MKNLDEFEKVIEKELEDVEGLILTTKWWNEGNLDTLKNLINMAESYRKTLSYIKQFRRGLIGE